jgi:hypothetical protein
VWTCASHSSHTYTTHIHTTHEVLPSARVNCACSCCHEIACWCSNADSTDISWCSNRLVPPTQRHAIARVAVKISFHYPGLQKLIADRTKALQSDFTSFVKVQTANKVDDVRNATGVEEALAVLALECCNDDEMEAINR